MKHLLIISLLLLISGCRSPKVNREFTQLQQKALKKTHSTVKWNKTDERIFTDVNESISRKRAIGIALENNMELQSSFEDLGIAKADLVQAGFFTNPRIDSLIKFPSPATRTEVEVAGSMNIADFWQVPIKTSIACSDLKIMTFTILRHILETTIEVKMAYDSCFYQQELLILIQDIWKKVQELRNRIIYRQKFGFERDLDRYFAISMAGKWEAKFAQQKAEVKKSYALLRRLLGINVSSESLGLTDSLTYEEITLPSITTLEQIGEKNRTTLQISQLEIQRAKQELSLQKAQVMNNVSFGISYKRDFDRNTQGWGPAIGFDLPLFDQNLAQISRAKFFIHKAKKAYIAEKLRMLEEVYHSYETANALKKEITVYNETIMPASEKGIAYSNKYFNRMQLNMIVLLEAQLALYAMQEERLNRQYQLALTFAELERSIGKVIY